MSSRSIRILHRCRPCTDLYLLCSNCGAYLLSHSVIGQMLSIHVGFTLSCGSIEAGDGHFDLMGSTGADLPAEPSVAGQRSCSGFGQRLRESPCQLLRRGQMPWYGSSASSSLSSQFRLCL